MKHWEVIVGNIGVVYSGDSKSEANENFNEYRVQSRRKGTRAYQEHVVMLADKTVEKEYTPSVVSETKIISMSLSGCCGNGKKVARELNHEQWVILSQLAKELSENDGHSTDFTVPFFYVQEWE